MTEMAVVIVNYNTRDHLMRCLASIQDVNTPAVVVSDNGSTDGSPEMVRTYYPGASLLVSPTNVGYGTAANRGIELCNTDYVLLLNSDTVVEPSAVDALKLFLDKHPRTAIAGPRLHNVDQSLQPSCYPFPTPFQIFLEESRLGNVAKYIPSLGDKYLRTWNHEEIRDVPWVLGAALAIRLNAYHQVDGFNQSFHLYYEEVDLCYRLRALGWQIHFAPVTTVRHAGGASTGQDRAALQYRLFCSAQRFYRLHYSRWDMLWLHVLLIPIMFGRLMRDALVPQRARSVRTQAEVFELRRVWLRILGDCMSVSTQTKKSR